METQVIVEVPQGSRNRYVMDHASGRIRLERMLFTSTRYPFDYGFIPGTLAEDGDALDAMILLSEPTFPGCMVTSRPVGVFWMHDEYGPDAKILAVPAHDPRYADIVDLGDVPEHQRSEIAQFFDLCKELEPGVSPDVRGWQDRAAADQVVTAALARAAGSAPVGHRVHCFRDRKPCSCGSYVRRRGVARPDRSGGRNVQAGVRRMGRAYLSGRNQAACQSRPGGWPGMMPGLPDMATGRSSYSVAYRVMPGSMSRGVTKLVRRA